VLFRSLGGIDDQLSGFQQPYANDVMPAELAGLLDEGRRAECREIFRRHIYGEYRTPYAEPERQRIRLCLADVRRAVGQGSADVLQMVASFERYIERDPGDRAGYIRGRDRSMYLNFRWLADRLPPRSRIIVWAANNHVAKDPSATGEYAGAGNLGSLVHEAYGRRAFALGFSALGGAHYWGRSEPSRAFASAAPGSLEALALAGSRADTVYLGPARLRALGTLPGSLFRHEPARARWSDALDGVIVFREERAPARTD